MNDIDWIPLMEGEFDHRSVAVSSHREGGFRVKTTQKGDETTAMVVEEDTTLFPAVISDGDPIEFDADTIEEMANDLLGVNFPKSDVLEIARLCRIPVGK